MAHRGHLYLATSVLQTPHTVRGLAALAAPGESSVVALLDLATTSPLCSVDVGGGVEAVTVPGESANSFMIGLDGR